MRQSPIRGKKSTRDKSTAVCHRCKELGNFSHECPAANPIPATGGKPNTSINVPELETNHLKIGNLTLNDDESDEDINDGSGLEFSSEKWEHQMYTSVWVLLEYQSTVDVFFNPD